SSHAASQQTPSTQKLLLHCVPSVQSSPLSSVTGDISSAAASAAAPTSPLPPSPPAPPVPSGIACVRAHAATRPHNATTKATRRTKASGNSDDEVLRICPALSCPDRLARDRSPPIAPRPVQSVTNRSLSSIQRRVSSHKTRSANTGRSLVAKRG